MMYNYSVQEKTPFILRNKDHAFEHESVTCVLVILFTPEFDILTIKNKRGYDIPGGHIETCDADFKETARRELLEEAQAIAGELTLCGMLESHDTDEPSYMLIMTGYIAKLDDFTPNDEIFDRSVMSASQFLSVYKAAPPELMADMIDQAKMRLDK